MNTRDGTMILFNEGRVSNLLPKDGTVNYYEKVLPSREANRVYGNGYNADADKKQELVLKVQELENLRH